VRYPAATRGQEPCPCITIATTKTDSKTDTEQKSGNVPEYRKHLKSLVLGVQVAPTPVAAQLCGTWKPCATRRFMTVRR
jgi:hypothetical protein